MAMDLGGYSIPFKPSEVEEALGRLGGDRDNWFPFELERKHPDVVARRRAWWLPTGLLLLEDGSHVGDIMLYANVMARSWSGLPECSWYNCRTLEAFDVEYIPMEEVIGCR